MRVGSELYVFGFSVSDRLRREVEEVHPHRGLGRIVDRRSHIRRRGAPSRGEHQDRDVPRPHRYEYCIHPGDPLRIGLQDSVTPPRLSASRDGTAAPHTLAALPGPEFLSERHSIRRAYGGLICRTPRCAVPISSASTQARPYSVRSTRHGPISHAQCCGAATWRMRASYTRSSRGQISDPPIETASLQATAPLWRLVRCGGFRVIPGTGTADARSAGQCGRFGTACRAGVGNLTKHVLDLLHGLPSPLPEPLVDVVEERLKPR